MRHVIDMIPRMRYAHAADARFPSARMLSSWSTQVARLDAFTGVLVAKADQCQFSDGTTRSNLRSHELHHTCMQVCKCADMQECRYNTFQRELFGKYMCTTANLHTEPIRGDRYEVSDDARIQHIISAEIVFWNVGRCVRERQVHLALGTFGRSFSGLGFIRSMPSIFVHDCLSFLLRRQFVSNIHAIQGFLVQVPSSMAPALRIALAFACPQFFSFRIGGSIGFRFGLFRFSHFSRFGRFGSAS
jgi:hypothetical protein